MSHRVGTLALDVEFGLTQPWSILFGPSGSGKTTVLRAIAGLLRPDAGKVVWRLADPPRAIGDIASGNVAFTVLDSSAKKFMPPHTRWIALAPQGASLFPHKSVAENVAYSIRRKNDPRRSEMAAMLALFRVAHIADKLPAALSGGEAQRVNLARAAVAACEAGVLLLDEPFTGLDVALRSELMRDLKAWAAERNLCVLSVTHDVAEAFELGAEVVKLKEGRVVAQGPVGVVLAEERKRVMEQLGG